MRDIRADLQERLAELDARNSEIVREYNRDKDALDRRFAEASSVIEDDRKAIGALLKLEMKRHGEVLAPEPPPSPLPDFLIQQVASRGTVSKDDLRLAASNAGFFSDGETGGRTIHTTLLNLVRASRLVEVPEGCYRMPTIADAFSAPQVQRR